MSEFVKAATLNDLEDPGMLVLEVDDRFVILFRRGDQLCCIDDLCTHDGGTLSDGEWQGGTIACPRHGAQFDTCNGRALTMPATQDTVAHEVKLEGTDVYVRLNENE